MRASSSWLIAAIVVASGPALAATTGDSVDVSRGERLAEQWCANCHAVEAKPPLQAAGGIPSFRRVAQLRSTTALSLRAFLLTPHPSMPNIKLDHDDLDEIIAYILSLKH